MSTTPWYCMHFCESGELAPFGQVPTLRSQEAKGLPRKCESGNALPRHLLEQVGSWVPAPDRADFLLAWDAYYIIQQHWKSVKFSILENSLKSGRPQSWSYPTNLHITSIGTTLPHPTVLQRRRCSFRVQSSQRKEARKTQKIHCIELWLAFGCLRRDATKNGFVLTMLLLSRQWEQLHFSNAFSLS